MMPRFYGIIVSDATYDAMERALAKLSPGVDPRRKRIAKKPKKKPKPKSRTKAKKRRKAR